VDATDAAGLLTDVLVTEDQIQARLREMAAEIAADYADAGPGELLLVGVLKGAVMVMADLSRALPFSVQMDWMAISSYGSGTRSSGVVRILKDLEVDLSGRHVLIVEDIVDTGLTLSWLVSNLESRGPASVRVCTLLRKPGRDPRRRRPLRRLRHPRRVRRRLRPGLCPGVPQPALRRDA